jgi:homoserine kinase
MTVVRVPATTANLGAGFDALGLALGRVLELELDADPTTNDVAHETHPATRAFVAAGGVGSIAVRTDFPPGRGMGFSGAARVAGVVAAAVQRGERWQDERPSLLAHAAELEGHADNAAASMYGGLVVVAGDRCVRVPTDLDPEIVLWIPERETSTKESRATLPASLLFDDAVFNLGRAALFVAAWAAGDSASLRTATEDRWHQTRRLGAVPESAAALEAMREAGAHGAWLSGSGPTVAALAADATTRAAIESALVTLTDHARIDILAVDHEGTTVR